MRATSSVMLKGILLQFHFMKKESYGQFQDVRFGV